MGWLADGDVNFTYKRAITLKGQAGCPTDYDVKVIVTNNGAPIEYSATGWTVNSKTGHYRIPFTVTEPDGIARTSGLQFDIPVDIGWLRHERYIPATADGDEFEFADADGVCCKYWYDNAMIQPNAPLNYSVVDITVKIPVTASQVKQMYLYFDPSWGTTANFSKADTFMSTVLPLLLPRMIAESTGQQVTSSPLVATFGALGRISIMAIIQAHDF